MTRFRSLFSREMVESPRERLTRITKETRRELEEREGRKKNETLANSKGEGRELQGMKAWTSKGLLMSPIYSFATPLSLYY